MSDLPARLHAMDTATLLTRLAEVLDAHDWDRFPGPAAPRLHLPARAHRRGLRPGRWVPFNADYPGFQHMSVEDLVADGDRGVLRARVTGTTGDGSEQLTSRSPASPPTRTASSAS